MTDQQQQPTILCISTYEKGQLFMQEVARLGVNVILLTVDKLEHADWPRESISKLVTMPENLTPQQVLNTVSYLARENRIDRIVPLDEFDLEVAALLREHMRLPGMGETLTRHFRDKLAMRVRARQCGVPVPEFTSVFNYHDIRSFLRHVPGPWLRLRGPRCKFPRLSRTTKRELAWRRGTSRQATSGALGCLRLGGRRCEPGATPHVPRRLSHDGEGPRVSK